MKYISLQLSNARNVTSMYKNCIFFNSLSSSLLQKRSVTLDTFARSDSELWIDSLPRLLYNLIMTYNDTVTCNSVIANGSINFTYDCWEMFRLATSRPLGERSEPFLAAKRPTASDEVARGRLVSLDGFHLHFAPKMGIAVTRIWGFRFHLRVLDFNGRMCWFDSD